MSLEPEKRAAIGWAVIDDGKIKFRTVSDTRRAAMVNWLVTEHNCMILYLEFAALKHPTAFLPLAGRCSRCSSIWPLQTSNPGDCQLRQCRDAP